jgi:hypothetical protein
LFLLLGEFSFGLLLGQRFVDTGKLGQARCVWALRSRMTVNWFVGLLRPSSGALDWGV